MTSINVGEIDGTILYEYPDTGVVVWGSDKRFRVVFDSVESANAAVDDLIFVHNNGSMARLQAQNIIFVKVEFNGTYSLEWHGAEIWRFDYTFSPG